jgi:hypothetical protein
MYQVTNDYNMKASKTFCVKKVEKNSSKKYTISRDADKGSMQPKPKSMLQ